MSRSPRTEAVTKRVRCAIYTRKSTEEGLDMAFNSLDAQRESAEAYIASQKAEGWTCVKERYDDGGWSGGNMERPALKRLMADIEAGRIDAVVTYKIDRLSRSLLDFARMMEVFERHGVALVSVTQSFRTNDSMGRLTLNMLLSFAQFEREVIGERIRDKIGAQRRRGMWAGGRPVLGYDVDRSGPSPRLVVSPDEAKRVREIFELYLSLSSLGPVVTELRRLNWRAKEWTTQAGQKKGGKPFDKGTLYLLLTNPIYLGKIVHKKQQFDGEHEAIIDPRTWDRVQSRLKANARAKSATLATRSGALLKGLLRCKACDSAMVHVMTRRKTRAYRYYVCCRGARHGRATCPVGSLPAAEIERVVVEEVKVAINNPAFARDTVKAARGQALAASAALATEREQQERALTRYRTELARVANGTGKGERVAELGEAIRRAERRLAEIGAAQPESSPVTAAQVRAAFADFDGLWESLTPGEQHRLLHLAVAKVEYDGATETVTVTFADGILQALSKTRKEAA